MNNQKYYGQYRKYLSSLLPLSSEEWESFSDLIDTKYLKKGELFLEESSPFKSNYGFVVEGILKQYFITNDGKEHITAFITENEIAADFIGMLKEIPCGTNIEALKDSVILSVSKPESWDKGDASLIFDVIEKVLAEINCIDKADRERDFLSLNATERYRKFCLDYANILNDISQSDAASYLGISSVSLSRIRGSKYY